MKVLAMATVPDLPDNLALLLQYRENTRQDYKVYSINDCELSRIRNVN